jgi:hypothetical protein
MVGIRRIGKKSARMVEPRTDEMIGKVGVFHKEKILDMARRDAMALRQPVERKVGIADGSGDVGLAPPAGRASSRRSAPLASGTPGR